MAICDVPNLNVPALCDAAPGWRYQGLEEFSGGLFGDGFNDEAGEHLALGIAVSNKIRPIKGTGRVSLALMGNSNTTQTFDQIVADSLAVPNLASSLVLADLAQAGCGTEQLADPSSEYWTQVFEAKLAAAGVSIPEIQVVWLKTPWAPLDEEAPPVPFPDHVYLYRDSLHLALQQIKAHLTNVRMVFLSSEYWAGYAEPPADGSPQVSFFEPRIYESFWGIKFLVQQQIDDLSGHTAGAAYPYITVGPYLWADGTIARSDGTSWVCPDDYKPDGRHPSAGSGRVKVSGLFWEFMESHQDGLTAWAFEE